VHYSHILRSSDGAAFGHYISGLSGDDQIDHVFHQGWVVASVLETKAAAIGAATGWAAASLSLLGALVVYRLVLALWP
jgi:hypothetical protein